MPPLGAEMDGEVRFVEVARQAAVKVRVVGGRDLGFGFGPKGRPVDELERLFPGLLHDGDGNRYVSGLSPDHALEPEAFQVILRLFRQMDDHASAAVRGALEGHRRN